MNTERVQEIEKDIRNWFDDKNAEDSFAFIAFNELVVAVKESQAEIIEYHKRIARAVTDEAKFRELNPLLDETTDVLLSRIFSLQLRMTPWQIWGEKEIISLHKQRWVDK